MMTASTERYLKEISRYPERAWKQTEHWLSPAPPPSKLSKAQVVGLAALALGVAFGIYFQADFVRYAKMRRM